VRPVEGDLPPVLAVVTVVYSLPSIALFMLLLPYSGLTQTTVIIPLTLYSLAALIPNVVDGIHGVSEDVRLAAVSMGFTGLRACSWWTCRWRSRQSWRGCAWPRSGTSAW